MIYILSVVFIVICIAAYIGRDRDNRKLYYNGSYYEISQRKD